MLNRPHTSRGRNPEDYRLGMNRSDIIMRRMLQQNDDQYIHDLMLEHNHLDDTKEPVFHMTIAPESKQ